MSAWFRFPIRLATALIMALVTALPAMAYEVEPMRMVLDIGAGRTTAVINVRNTRDQALPIEVVFKRRIVNPDGSQEFLPAEEDFSVFPPLALIQPGQSQAVRVTYIGDPSVENSQAYIAEVQEVPVTQEDFTGVVFAYNFGVAVYLRADQAQANVQVTGASRTEYGVAFSVANSGTDFAMLGELDLRLQAGSDTVRLSPAQVSEAVENPIIPPGASREFHLAISDLPDGPIGVSLGRAF
ncbi:MAG: molecular chaperone [Alphaproteobacteria bacterium]|nr:molecular chaperone [Alphaproteobacteria bacterium]